jgi:hypothetical protein
MDPRVKIRQNSGSHSLKWFKNKYKGNKTTEPTIITKAECNALECTGDYNKTPRTARSGRRKCEHEFAQQKRGRHMNQNATLSV